MSVNPGWYPDPQNPAQQRWWDGAAWTAHTAPAAPSFPAPSAPHPQGFAQQAPYTPQTPGFTQQAHVPVPYHGASHQDDGGTPAQSPSYLEMSSVLPTPKKRSPLLFAAAGIVAMLALVGAGTFAWSKVGSVPSVNKAALKPMCEQVSADVEQGKAIISSATSVSPTDDIDWFAQYLDDLAAVGEEANKVSPDAAATKAMGIYKDTAARVRTLSSGVQAGTITVFAANAQYDQELSSISSSNTDLKDGWTGVQEKLQSVPECVKMVNDLKSLN